LAGGGREHSLLPGRGGASRDGADAHGGSRSPEPDARRGGLADRVPASLPDSRALPPADRRPQGILHRPALHGPFLTRRDVVGPPPPEHRPPGPLPRATLSPLRIGAPAPPGFEAARRQVPWRLSRFHHPEGRHPALSPAPDLGGQGRASAGGPAERD